MKTNEILNLCLEFIFGVIVAYFVSRFIRFNRWPSVGVALLPVGWIVLALDLGSKNLENAKMLGICAGLVLLCLVSYADRGDRK